MTPLDEPPKVSIFSRVLAWVFVFCGVLGIAGWIIQIYDEGWPWDWGATLLATLGLLLIFPLFFFVALKGRPPRWFNFIENQYNQQIGDAVHRTGDGCQADRACHAVPRGRALPEPCPLGG